VAGNPTVLLVLFVPDEEVETWLIWQS